MDSFVLLLFFVLIVFALLACSSFVLLDSPCRRERGAVGRQERRGPRRPPSGRRSQRREHGPAEREEL